MPKAKYKKRKDGRYGTSVQNGYNDDGSPNRIPLYAKSSAELERLVAEVKYELRKGTYVSDKNMTFGEYALTWLNAYHVNSGIRTKEMYKNIVHKYLAPLQNRKLLSLRLSDFQEIINENADHIRTCEMIVCTAKQIISYAIEDGYMTKNVTLRLKAPKRKGKKNYPGRRPLTNLEINAIEKADLDKKQRAYIELLRGCGLRPGEIIALKPSNFNWMKNTVRIDEAITYDRNNVVWKEPKSEAGYREIDMPPKCITAIKNYLPEVHDTVVFPMQRKEGAMTKSSQRKFWEGILKQIRIAAGKEILNGQIINQKIFDLVQYTFRHNYCTELYYSNRSLLEAVRLMGHSDYKMIMEIYAHLDESEEKKRTQKQPKTAAFP